MTRESFLARLDELAQAHVQEHGRDGGSSFASKRTYRAGYLQGARDAFDIAASKCCTIDSSDSSHDTAESNANAIRAKQTELLSETKAGEL